MLPFQKNDRVRTRGPIEGFPHFRFEEIGLTGTVQEVYHDTHAIQIKMDRHFPELDPWDNCLWLSECDGQIDGDIELIDKPHPSA